MKTQMRLLCFAVVTLMAEAQIHAELPAQILDNFRFPLDNYRPLMDLLQIETVYPENVDLSTVSVRSLTFPAQETNCSELNTSMEGQECPLKENGKRMYCSATVSYITQDGDIQGFEFSCEAIKEAFLVKNRVRRSRSGRGSGRGGRGGSSGGRGGSSGGRGGSSGGRGGSNGGRSGSSGGRGGSRGGRGGSRGSRPGGGSSIAGNGNRNNGGTRTA